ncbi:MAG: prepilin-type N-terminal cleavage/methylation domain-containing protein [Desulfitobacterium hafniense]|nr:prepilin-type N-terminal cleavage/methylation domain-containing protein [Desulfitobacterium hafniense]
MVRFLKDLYRFKLGANNAKGFTLLEVMIVLAIISITAVVGVPKYQGVKDQYRLEGSGQTVISELKYSKQLAMDQRRTTYVVFSNSQVQTMQVLNGNYQVLDSKKFETGVSFDPSQNSWLTRINDLNTGVLVGWGMSYNYQGFASSFGTISLKHGNGRTVGVRIAEKTGMITLTWP